MKNLVYAVSLLTVSFLVVSGCNGGGGENGSLTDQQKALIDNIVECVRLEKQLPGVALSVIKDGEVIYDRGYGKADIASGADVTGDTLFAIGSVTKIFTTFAVLQLVEEILASLDDQIGEYLPDLPNENWKIVTIRDLLSMTSGIPEYSFCKGGAHDGEACQVNTGFPNFPEPDGCGAEAVCESANRVPYPEYLEGVSPVPVQFPPGSQYFYSNTNFIILGLLVEELSGADYQTYVDDHVIGPLDMTNTFPNTVPPPAIIGLATPYRITADPGPEAVPCVTFDNPPGNCALPEPGGVMCEVIPPDELRLPEQSFSAGWLVSNLKDFHNLESVLHNLSPILLEPVSYEEMWTNMEFTNNMFGPFGLGWGVCSELDEGPCPFHLDPLSGGPIPDEGMKENPAVIGKVVSKDGALAGYSSFIARYLEDGLTIVVFINTLNPKEPAELKFGPGEIVDPVADVVRTGGL